MLEVVFSESTKASMRQAKGKSLVGSKEDIVNIGFSLDIGDISAEIDGMGRKDIFRKIWNLNPDNKEGKKFFNNQIKDIEKLLSVAKEGQDIRIWKTSSAFSVCGYAFVCNLLEEIDCNISLVSFPEYHQVSDNLVLTASSWDSVVADDLDKFLIYEKDINYIVKLVQANLWEDLKRENAHLRAIVNGKLISVPESFYDHLILRNIPDGEFSMVSLIGKLLGEYELGVSDSWFAYRIRRMIEEGNIKVVSDKKPSGPHDMVLKKADIWNEENI